MKDLSQRKLFIFLVILSVIDVVVYYLHRSNTYFDFLNWNLFLAWIPFVMSSLVYLTYKRSKKMSFYHVILGFLWLLFFPNSPYVITDLIHLTINKSIYATKGVITIAYWFDLLVILLFAWTCLLLGAISTYQIQFMLSRVYNKLVSWCFVIISAIAGGYGILLGREYRLNSWEVVTDLSKVTEIIKRSLSSHSILFCLFFGLFIGIVYVTIYFLINSLSKSDT